ncbi:MAG: TIR domain-containing protein [Chloroflexi bacterium]|nr:TIR domain-containing protein [Chloroflexota bacterium]
MLAPRHKVFVSYHHANDEAYRNAFEKIFADRHDILVPKSVQIGDIDPNLPTERVRQIIREEYLHDSTVIVVLIGSQTWQRKHVDWEIGSSIRQTALNTRSGLLGILLPTYPFPSPSRNTYDPNTIPPRLYDNLQNNYATIHLWNTDPSVVSEWIDAAFRRRTSMLPNNSRLSFGNNRSGPRWQE